ncbi:MAG: DNA polymerase III subunit beta [Bacteroidales bacterium]|nr:DNA polymerase III subunit beta [Bacteroidales bacterium]
MKFVVSSIDLLNHLQTVSRVINPKNTLPILDNFLFNLDGKNLEITASDLETTMITYMQLQNTSDSGTISIPARLLIDTLKEFPEQPLTFDINPDTLAIVITTENGQFTIVGQNGADFPQVPSIKEDKKTSLQIEAESLEEAITSTLFATADDELRPVMNGIYLDIAPDNITFVASDAHKLVRYKRNDIKSEINASFILPKKPASLLKTQLVKEKGNILIEVDEKNALFTLSQHKLVCRLVEGNYPSYNSVIPTDNQNKLIIDRLKFLNTLRRVSVFSNQASNLVKMHLTGNQVTVSAQDIDFSISAYERIPCQYEGDEMDIGFKSVFLIEILTNLQSSDVVVELSDPSRAGLFLPLETDNEKEEVLMLLMPMMINN